MLSPGEPMAAFLREVFALAELLGLELAAQQGAAVGVGPVGEVLAGDADAARARGPQQPGFHELPLIHAPYASTPVLLLSWCHCKGQGLFVPNALLTMKVFVAFR